MTVPNAGPKPVSAPEATPFFISQRLRTRRKAAAARRTGVRQQGGLSEGQRVCRCVPGDPVPRSSYHKGGGVFWGSTVRLARLDVWPQGLEAPLPKNGTKSRSMVLRLQGQDGWGLARGGRGATVGGVHGPPRRVAALAFLPGFPLPQRPRAGGGNEALGLLQLCPQPLPDLLPPAPPARQRGLWQWGRFLEKGPQTS